MCRRYLVFFLCRFLCELAKGISIAGLHAPPLPRKGRGGGGGGGGGGGIQLKGAYDDVVWVYHRVGRLYM